MTEPGLKRDHVSADPQAVATNDAPTPSPLTRMRLRYAGTCRECGSALPQGERAVYDRSTKTVLCLSCLPTAPTTDPTLEPAPQEVATAPHAGLPGLESTVIAAPVASNKAGASAQREYERRKAKREESVRTKHPHIGAFLLAVTDEPQSTRAWAVGAKGEELLGQRLDGMEAPGVTLLHDRRIPRTRANIDHIAVTPSGVFVIDAKRYKNKRPTLRVEGGLIRARTEKLLVAGRDRSSLVDGMIKQTALVRSTLNAVGHTHVAVHGVLCFVEADWPLIGGSFVTREVQVTWPKKLAAQLAKPGDLDPAATQAVLQTLATAFPPA